MHRTYFYLALCTLFPGWACISDEMSMDAQVPASVIMTADTRDHTAHVYLNLDNQNIAGTHSLTGWDLAFDCREDSFNIHLNWTKGMACYNTGLTRLSEYEFNEDVDWRYEQYPMFSEKSSALGEWGDYKYHNPKSYGIFYLLSLGYNAYGAHLGYRLLNIKHFEDSSYHIEYIDPLHPMESAIFSIPKRKDRAFQYFTFQEGGQLIDAGIQEKEWHLMLSPFVSAERKSPYDREIDSSVYLSFGFFAEPGTCQVAIDTSRTFESIRYIDALQMNFSANPASMAAGWYYWDKNTQENALMTKVSYILKVNSGKYYKMKMQELERTNYGISVKLAVQGI